MVSEDQVAVEFDVGVLGDLDGSVGAGVGADGARDGGQEGSGLAVDERDQFAGEVTSVAVDDFDEFGERRVGHDCFSVSLGVGLFHLDPEAFEKETEECRNVVHVLPVTLTNTEDESFCLREDEGKCYQDSIAKRKVHCLRELL